MSLGGAEVAAVKHATLQWHVPAGVPHRPRTEGAATHVLSALTRRLTLGNAAAATGAGPLQASCLL